MPEATRELLARARLHASTTSTCWSCTRPTCASTRRRRRRSGLPDAKVHNNIQKYGNTTSATLPLCFHEARQAGKAPEGALVAFAALGAGLHWGSVLMRV